MNNPENTQPTADASRHTPAEILAAAIDRTANRAANVLSFGFNIPAVRATAVVTAEIETHLGPAHARLTRQAEAAKVLRDQLEAVAAELRLRPTDPRSYSLDSYLPEKMYDPILSALAVYEEATRS